MNVMKNILASFDRANAGYIARNPEKGAALGDKMQPDIQAGLNVFKRATEAQIKTLEALGVDWDRFGSMLGACSNVKIARRAPQFALFIVTGDGQYLKGSAQTGLLEYCALLIGAKTKDALRFASTGCGNENTSDEISVQRARKIQKAFGKVKTSSRDTQASVAFSKGGMLDLFGLVTPWAKGATMPAPTDCKLGRALAALIENASDARIELWAQQAGVKGE